MSNAELLIEEIRTLPSEYIAEVLDFVGYLKGKHSQGEIGGECPGPGLGHSPNAVTLAAMREAEDILTGKIQGAVSIDPLQYKNREELKKALKEALQN
jgi:hypothetical protein